MTESGRLERARPDWKAVAEPDDVVSEFLIESRENLDQLDRDLMGLEKNPLANDLLASIFRTIHTIKGTSGFLAFGKLEALAHAGETLLSRVRDCKLSLNAEVTSTLLAMVDCIRATLVSIELTRQEGNENFVELIDKMTTLAFSADSDGVVSPISVANALAIHEAPNRACDEDGCKPIGQLLVEHAGVEPKAVMAARELQRLGDLRSMGEILVSQGAVTPSAARAVVAYQQEARSASVADTCVRVDVALLDKLILLVGELMGVRDQMVQWSTQAHDPVFLEALQHHNLITTELQREVMKARRQPIGILWNRVPRIVRDLALAGGKRVRVEMYGADIELDRRLLEAIKGPLTHLVRNAIDHGIETPPQRVAAGKPPEGCVTLRACHEGGQVNLQISDDGVGVDLDLVKQKAAAQGLISGKDAARMRDCDVANLVFLPGLTTAEKVTNVSGRGVGMDVVKTNVEKIGGSVDLQTWAGKGTTVTLKIPFTETPHGQLMNEGGQ